MIWLISSGFAVMILMIGWALLKARRQGATANVDALVSELGVVTEEINPKKSGRVLLHGSYWRAYADEKINVDSEVVVKRIDGTKIFVEKTTKD